MIFFKTLLIFFISTWLCESKAMPLHSIIKSRVSKVYGGENPEAKYLALAQKNCHVDLLKQLLSSSKFPRLNSLQIINVSALKRGYTGGTYIELDLVDGNSNKYSGHFYTMTGSKPTFSKYENDWVITCSADLVDVVNESIFIKHKTNGAPVFVASCASDMIYYHKKNEDERCEPLATARSLQCEDPNSELPELLLKKIKSENNG